MRLLHYDELRAPGSTPDRWMLVLHGIFGTGRNWATVVRRVVAERPDWGALLVDLREHGGSTGFPPPHTLAAAAGDLAGLVRATGLPVRGVLGHSFGGKVALAFARDHGAGLERVWVVDSTPDPLAPGGEAWAMLRTVKALPAHYASRAEAVAALERSGVRTPVARWMATNLEAAPGGGYRWRLDFDAIESLLLDFFRADLWPVILSPPGRAVIHVVKASESGLLSPGAVARIRDAARTGRVVFHELPGSHWVHAEHPEEVQALLVETLPSAAG